MVLTILYRYEKKINGFVLHFSDFVCILNARIPGFPRIQNFFRVCGQCGKKSSPIRQPITLLNYCFRFASREQIRQVKNGLKCAWILSKFPSSCFVLLCQRRPFLGRKASIREPCMACTRLHGGSRRNPIIVVSVPI